LRPAYGFTENNFGRRNKEAYFCSAVAGQLYFGNSQTRIFYRLCLQSFPTSVCLKKFFYKRRASGSSFIVFLQPHLL